MKRVLGLLTVCLIVFAIYYDLTEGTLPKAESQESIKETISKETISNAIHYEEVTVKPGDTLISIIERLEGFPEQVSINQIVEDFTSLNEGISPEQIQSGKTYKIPLYTADEQF